MTGIAVGVDPSFTRTGLAAWSLDEARLLTTSSVRAPAKTTGLELVPRALKAAAKVRLQVADWSLQHGAVRLIGVEALVNSQHAGHTNGIVGGLVRAALLEAGWPLVEVPAGIMKKTATGRGNAQKTEVLTEAVLRLGYTGGVEDEADAAWLAVVAGLTLGTNPGLPKAHAVNLAKVGAPYRWPT